MHDNLSQVFIGYLRVDERSASALPDLASLLQKDERERLYLLQKTADQLQFAAGRALARMLLDRVAATPAGGWLFVQTRTGKPVLQSPPSANIDFSIAHTAELVAVAVCRGCLLGIDVENTNTVVDMPGIASLCFSSAETELLRNEAVSSRADLFFSLWVMKEACSKAQQTGLSAPLRDFGGHLDGLLVDSPLVLEMQGWSVRRSRPTPEHLLAVAVRKDGGCNVSWIEQEVRLQDLLPKR